MNMTREYLYYKCKLIFFENGFGLVAFSAQWNINIVCAN